MLVSLNGKIDGEFFSALETGPVLKAYGDNSEIRAQGAHGAEPPYLGFPAQRGEDMAETAKLDIGRSEIVDHSDPGFVKMLHGMKIHE